MTVKNLFSKTKGKITIVCNALNKIINVLIILVFLISAVGLKPALAGWFDQAWTYRRPVTVSNSSGTPLTDYQALITLDSSFDFGHTNIEGADVRFASEGGTALPFWIESWDPIGTLARIWVKIPSFLPEILRSIFIMATRQQARQAVGATLSTSSMMTGPA